MLLNLTAVLGALCALLAVLAVVFGVRPIVFRSGSMEPAVGTGALGFSRATDAADLKVGDIVTVTNAQKKTITHRILAIGPGDGSATLQLKGDDNPVADQEIYKVEAAPKLWFAVPDGGYVIAWFSNAPGSYLLGGYVVLMLMLAFRRGVEHGPSSPEAPVDVEPAAAPIEKTSPGRPMTVVAVGAVVALAAAVVAGWSQATWAAWTDEVSTSGTSVTTATVAAPVVTCTKGNSIVTMSWAAVPGVSGYTLHYGPAGATSESVPSATLSKVFNVVGQTGTFTVNAIFSSWSSTASNAKTYVIGNGVGNTSCV